MDNTKVEYTLLWFIENYSHCWHRQGEALNSPKFTAEELEGTVWFLSVYPRGFSHEGTGHVSVGFERLWSDKGPKSFTLKFEVSFLSADGSVLQFGAHKLSFENGLNGKVNDYKWPTFVQMDEIRKNAEYLPNDILTVRCKMTKGKGKVHKTGHISARTRIGIEKISFLHAVECFSELEPNKKEAVQIRSYSNGKGDMSSNLHITECSCSEDCPHCEISIEIIPSESEHNICKYKISALSGVRNIIGCVEADNRFDATRKDIRKIPLTLTKKLIRNSKNKILPDDKLLLLCEYYLSTGLEIHKLEETQHAMPITAIKHISTYSPSKSVYNTVENPSAYPSVLDNLQSLTYVKLKAILIVLFLAIFFSLNIRS